MDASELMTKVIEYGADEDGIRDRFDGNVQLYELCFREFLQEQNFAALAAALEEGNYSAAFDAAHALKGISGNLGVSAFYAAICQLVEALRAKDYGDLPAQYAQVCRQREKLSHLLSGEDDQEPLPPVEPPVSAEAEEAVQKAANAGERLNKYLPVWIGCIFIVILLVAFMFFKIAVNYRQNIVRESGRHLTEMGMQIAVYIEGYVDQDWRIARSVGDSVTVQAYVEDDEALMDMLRRKQAVWGTSDLMLYTENGNCVYVDGSVEMNDVASDIIVGARQNGQSLSVVASRLIYTVPIETQMCYKGSKIAAISVVRDMATFLDDMDFSSFDDEAQLYLTDDTGIIVSMLNSPTAVSAFNISSVVRGRDIVPLGEGLSPKDFLEDQSPAAFLLNADGGTGEYGVSVPVHAEDETLHLFYLVPEAVVNDAMNDFSRRFTIFSIMMILLFSLLVTLAFMFAYMSRKKLFDRALHARDRMFDLLISNTRTAFALFRTNQAEPSYISGNAARVVGDPYWALDRDEKGYCMRSSTGQETDTLRQANEMLRGWDGMSAFKSGYIHSEQNGAPFCFEYQLYPVDDEGTDFVGIAQDVTQAYEREEATKEAMEMAARANEAKSRFLSNMSHDMRTPMNAIINMTNFALENIDRPKRLGPYLHTIHESSVHLLNLINDVLDMSRIESGQTVVASASFDLKAEIEKQLNIVRPLCAARGQTLIVELEALRCGAVLGDALKVSQVVMNLLSNAVKFTPERGAVRFCAGVIPSLREDLVDVRITVEDNGIGISEEDLAHIFEPFNRANDKRVSKIEGTGLGLSICKSYVEAMGGSLRCESEIGEGSIFTVELFFRKASGAPSEEAVSQPLGDAPFLGMRCLVAEDNPINQLIARTLLERSGFIADFADDGSECVHKFLTAKPGTYDVIYMDIQMPVMDGYQAAIEIRSCGSPQAKTVPIVAMTANVFAEDVEKTRVAGMDAYVAKPIVSFDLIEQTNKALKNKSPLRAAQDGPSPLNSKRGQ